MNILSRDKQIEVISALTEGLGVRATARITGVNRETVGTLALRVGRAGSAAAVPGNRGREKLRATVQPKS